MSAAAPHRAGGRDGIVDRNPAKVRGWQQEYKRAKDELDDPRALGLPDWAALERLADALMETLRGQLSGRVGPHGDQG